MKDVRCTQTGETVSFSRLFTLGHSLKNDRTELQTAGSVWMRNPDDKKIF